jgi:hypothetical protein
MQLLRAFYAFYRTLVERECEHRQIASPPGATRTSGFCPDCGYQVRIGWTFCRCRTCGSKRHPKQEPDGRISPLYRYCQHCGQADYQIIRKERIHAYEMPYAILTKEIDYTEERRQPSAHRAENPFEIYRRLDIVEGEVLRKEEGPNKAGFLS